MVGRRICLVTPGHLSTNPRLVKEADALASAGYDVEVIAADYMQWGRKQDRVFASRPWRVKAAITFGPLSPIAKRVRQVLCHRAARAAVEWGVKNQAVCEVAWHPIVSDLITATKRVKADLYVAHYPAALPAAAKAAGLHGSRYAFDAEDYHLGDPPDSPGHDIERQLTRAIEGRYLPGAAYVSAASPGIADAYADAYSIPRPLVLLNVFPCSYAPAALSPRGDVSPGPSVYWFSQTIGADRGLQAAIRAIGLAASKPHLYLRGNAAAGIKDTLQRIAYSNLAVDRVHFLELADPGEMVRLAAAYDIGLVSETGHTRNRDLCLTNKLFSFLLAGIPPVMSATRAHVSFSREVRLDRLLYPIDNAEALANIFDRIFLKSTALAKMRATAYALGRGEFNWDYEQRKLLSAVQIALPESGISRAKNRLIDADSSYG